MKVRLNGSILDIDDEVCEELKVAPNEVLLKKFFEYGGLMNEEDGFVSVEPENYQTQKSFFSFLLLINFRGQEGQKVLFEAFEKFKKGEIDHKGKIMFAN